MLLLKINLVKFPRISCCAGVKCGEPRAGFLILVRLFDVVAAV